MSINLLQATNLNEISYTAELSKNNTTGIITVPSNTIYKIDSLYITNKYQCNIPVTVSVVVQNTTNTQLAYIGNEIPIDASETIEFITQDRPVVLLANQRLHCMPSHNFALDIHLNYTKIS